MRFFQFSGIRCIKLNNQIISHVLFDSCKGEARRVAGSAHQYCEVFGLVGSYHGYYDCVNAVDLSRLP
jgi:hypothetical protein